MSEIERAMYQAITEIVGHPYAQVCKHWAALVILDHLERAGVDIPHELAETLTFSNDDRSFQILADLRVGAKDGRVTGRP